MRPLLLLEVNEVPWRVVDRFRSDPRYPNIARFFAGASTYTSITVDKPGMLDPWVTWPSLHRGMDNKGHNVKNLGQDPETFKGTPIWEEYRRRGLTIGVCGSLQSWPPKDPGKGGFYIPDTFSHDEKCIPSFVEPFQKFNLGQVARNGRVIKGDSLFSPSVLNLLASLPRLGISGRTLSRLASHLIAEIRDKSRRARRPIFQTVLLWDVFKTLYKPEAAPAFSTFFTNHVASIMHRYWKHIFPEDFGDRYKDDPKVHLATMEFAMEILDGMLADAMKFVERNPDLILVFASSMGQKAIIHDWHEGYEASVPHLEKLMAACGVETGSFKPLLAMVPQIAVTVADPGARQRLKLTLLGCRTESDKSLFAVLEEGASLSISILTPKVEDIKAGSFRIPAQGKPVPVSLKWEAAGIAMNPVDPGTAYHFPEGTLAAYGKGIAPLDERKQMGADEVKAFMMGIAGLHEAEKPLHQLEAAR